MFMGAPWQRGTMIAMLLLTGMVQAAPHDNGQADGEHGHLRLHGLLLEGACRLDMTSAYQAVLLGDTPRGRLRHPGDRGRPVTFRLRFHDCIRRGGAATDPLTGTLSWDARQPVITVSFLAPADADRPALLKTRGISGVALHLQDGLGRLVRPGQQGRPQFIEPIGDALIYTVTPVRTPAPLTSGPYRAVADFRVSYD